MSQSDIHRQIVIATAMAIRQRYPEARLATDLAEAPGDPVPPLIGGHRPDILGRSHDVDPRQLLIAEAKTDDDIDNHHTWCQITAFVDHLSAVTSGTGVFVLAVNGHVAGTARTVLRFACREHVSERLRIRLFDGLDFWSLGPLGAPLWRLS